MTVVHKRVLLIVNHDRYADIARQAFARDNGEFVLDRVCNVKKARERLADAGVKYDIVIADHELLDGDVMELFLRDEYACPFPFVIIIDENDTETAIKAMKMGAVDLLPRSIKGFSNLPMISRHAIEEWERRKALDDKRVLGLYDKRLHSILKDIDEMYFEADLKGNITFFNDSVSKKTGYSPEELKGASYRDIADVDVADRLFKLFHKVYQTRKPSSVQGFIFTTKKGISLVTNIFVYPAINTTGKVSGFRCFARDVTKRNEDEKALREAASYWEATFNAIPDGIMILDSDQKVLRSNRSMAEFAGKDIESMLGRQCWELVHHTNGPIPECPFTKMRKTLKRESIELFMNNRWFDITIDPIADEKGSLTGGVHIIRDITARKLMEREFKESEQRFRSIAESSPMAVLMYQDDRWIYVNPGAERISGYSVDELKNMNFWDIVHPDYREIVRQRGQARQMGESAHTSYEFKIITKHGEEKWVYLTGGSIEWEGKHAGIITVIDITPRKQMEQALKESEEKYRNILEDIEDGYYETDKTGKLTFANKSLYRILGYPSKDLLGKSGRVFMDGESLEKVRQVFKRVYVTGEPEKGFDWEMTRKDGSKRAIETSISLISDAEGRKVGFRGMVRDITDRKRMEELERQLLHAQKLEAIGTLAGGIAHDFNNILTAILGNISLVKTYLETNGKIYEKVCNAEEAALKARKLVRRILSFSRQDIGKRRSVDMASLVDETLEMLRATIPATIEIHKDLDYKAGLVDADPSLLEQVLMNLCTNALHAMGSKGGMLDVRLKRVYVGGDSPLLTHGLLSGAHVVLQVRDTGSGISPEIKDRIFDPYFTTKDVGEGSGLGLAIVNGIVRKYGGAVTVDSVLGKGSSFNVYLPVTDAREEPEDIHADTDELPRGRENILLVDDEDIVLKIGKDMLERLGYKVMAFSNSTDALNVFRLEPKGIDLVVTDMVMPLMDGRTLAREIVKIRPDVPIILCTGYNDKVTSEDADRTGIKGFIMKPFMLREIALKVRNVLDSK